MSELFSGAKEALDRAKEKAAPVLEDVKEKAMETAAGVREKAAPVIEDVKEKAAPVVEKVRDAADSAVDAVKEGAEKVGELFRKDAPAPNVKNEFFSGLEEEVRAQKDAAKAQAEEMQRRLHEMLHGKKEEPKDE